MARRTIAAGACVNFYPLVSTVYTQVGSGAMRCSTTAAAQNHTSDYGLRPNLTYAVQLLGRSEFIRE